MNVFKSLILALVLLGAEGRSSVALAERFLLMAERPGCTWCERFNKELAAIYPKTVEGVAAPLVRYDITQGKAPASLVSAVHFTPTFILIEDGIEIGRIEEHAVHVCDFSCLPTRQVLIESRSTVKHALHIYHARDIPSTDRHIKGSTLE